MNMPSRQVEVASALAAESTGIPSRGFVLGSDVADVCAHYGGSESKQDLSPKSAGA
jgi:hypothetical protein